MPRSILAAALVAFALPAAAQVASPPGDWPMQEGWQRVELAAISTDALVGADIRTLENESVATVDDVLLDDAGAIAALVARFGGLLGFGTQTVALGMDEVDIITETDGSVFVRTVLQPEELELRPEHEG